MSRRFIMVYTSFVLFSIYNMFYMSEVIINPLNISIAYALAEKPTVDPNPCSYIIIKSKSPREYLADAESLSIKGEYEKALPICNYVIDITKDKVVRNDAIKQKHALKKSISKKVRELKAQNNEKVKELNVQALSIYRADDLDAAESKFNEILVIDPDNSAAKTYLNTYIPRRKAELSRAQEKAAENAAREKQAAAKKENQQKISDLYRQGKIYYGDNNFDSAVKSFKEVLSLDPEHSAANRYLNTYIPRRKEQIKNENYIK